MAVGQAHKHNKKHNRTLLHLYPACCPWLVGLNIVLNYLTPNLANKTLHKLMLILTLVMMMEVMTMVMMIIRIATTMMMMLMMMWQWWWWSWGRQWQWWWWWGGGCCPVSILPWRLPPLNKPSSFASSPDTRSSRSSQSWQLGLWSWWPWCIDHYVQIWRWQFWWLVIVWFLMQIIEVQVFLKIYIFGTSFCDISEYMMVIMMALTDWLRESLISGHLRQCHNLLSWQIDCVTSSNNILVIQLLLGYLGYLVTNCKWRLSFLWKTTDNRVIWTPPRAPYRGLNNSNHNRMKQT